ncbi:MAG: putative lipopolysaccharide heptosyltransferase III [Burkholderiales bacterium]|nr:putative lipopolysaccharide heptosyltransferase III [Burkholderiales bacterium]
MMSSSIWQPLPGDAVALPDIRRVLIIKLRHIGDVLLTSPMFSVFAAQAPHAEVDALVYRDTADMLSGHPAIAQLHTIDRRWKRLGPVAQLRHEWGLIRTLRARRYDLVIHLTEHWRGAWLTRLLGPRYAVAPAGPYGRLFDRCFTHRYWVPPGNRRHTVEIHLDSLRRIGVYPGDGRARALVFEEGAAAHGSVDRMLAERGLARGSFIAVHPASRWHFKCWPVEHMVHLIDGLQSQHHTVVLTCGPDPAELEINRAITTRLRQPVVDLGGQLTLKELGALIRRAKLFIGVDSAPMHMAAAVGTPTVALFGPSGDIEWGPWQVPSRVLTSDHRCRPCGFDGCGGGKRSECLQAIAPERALAAAEELLGAAA